MRRLLLCIVLLTALPALARADGGAWVKQTPHGPVPTERLLRYERRVIDTSLENSYFLARAKRGDEAAARILKMRQPPREYKLSEDRYRFSPGVLECLHQMTEGASPGAPGRVKR